MTALAPILEGFFTDRLHALRASEHTIAGYRDTYRLLLRFAHERTGRQPSQLDLSELDATLITAFLDHLEDDRANSVATRNVRMAAIRALFRYAALRCPEHAALIQRVLAIPTKRGNRQLVTFLNRTELFALLEAPDQRTPLGRRDYLLLAVAVQTGLRLSELTGLTCADATLGTGAHVRCTSKGRKERITPLTKTLARELARWLTERRAAAHDPLFPTIRGNRLSSDAVQRLLAKHLAVAAGNCPSLTTKHVTPHTLRHSCAMNLLQAGIDTSSISLWSATPTPAPPRPTCTPTSPSKNGPWRSPRRPRAAPGPRSDTGHRTGSSRSSKRCSYADPQSSSRPARHTRQRPRGITPDAA